MTYRVICNSRLCIGQATASPEITYDMAEL